MAASNVKAEVTETNLIQKVDYTAELTVLTSLFFIWGFITCLNDILIPHLKAVFLLNYAEEC